MRAFILLVLLRIINQILLMLILMLLLFLYIWSAVNMPKVTVFLGGLIGCAWWIFRILSYPKIKK